MTARLHKGWTIWATLAGLILIFVGERVLDGYDGVRTAALGAAGVALLASLGMRVVELGADSQDDKRVRMMLAACTAGVVLAIGIYALIPLTLTGAENAKVRGLVWVAWPVVLGCALGPLLAVELAVMPSARASGYELRRVRRAFERGLALALLLSVVFVGNWLAERHDVKKDFSFARNAKASDTTIAMVEALSKPVTVTLFFPKANDVYEVLEQYFEPLEGLSPNLTMRVLDQALASKEASAASVNENGYVDIAHDKNHEKVRVGLKLRSAGSALKSFDSSFAKALVKVAREESVAYFTVGHGERSVSPKSSDKRPGLRTLKQQLKANQYDVKDLGIAEGLGAEVPRDASIVFVMGPEKAFAPEEVDSLKRAIDRGVRLLIALEADRPEDQLGDGSEPMADVLAKIGLSFDPTILINEQKFVRVNRNEGDKAFIFSNRYSSHASVTTMTRHSTRLATLFAKTGSLQKAANTPAGFRVDMVLNALEATFRDTNRNLRFDEGETKEGYGLAAAVTKTSTGAGSAETRAFVLADVDVLTDKYIRFHGNPYMLADIVYWLRDIKEPVLPTVSEEDVRIVHKRDEDAAWFYGTTFGAPALVLLFGFFSVSMRRRS